MSRMKAPAEVRFEAVTKSFGPVVAVDAVSFIIEPGTLVTLLGPSGCGKTTTLRLIAGLEMPTSGRILIGGADVTRLAATERDVSMVFQSYALFPHMTVEENVAYGLKVGGLPKAEIRAKTEEGLDLVGLKGFGRRRPSELSGGQQQRVAVARALVLEPQVMLFDEPLSNLDAKLRRRVREDIRELQRTLSVTSVYVTHDQEEALAVSDKIIVMRNAAIAQEGSPRDLYERPADRFVADFIGDANLVAGCIVRVDGTEAVVEVGGLSLALPRRGLDVGEVEVAIRPDALRLMRDGAAGPGLKGVVTKAAYLGDHMEYSVASPVGELFVVDDDVGRPVGRGNEVGISLADHGIAIVGRRS